MASLFQDLVLDEAHSEEPRLEAEGFEAPRNSSDEGRSCRSSSEDVRSGSKLASDGRDEKKRWRASNVVARLMGLDAMPDAFRTRTSSQQMPQVQAPGRAGARDHPQEAELQRFKQEFAAKQQRDDVDRQLEEKKRKVRATLDKARLALSQGIVAAEPKHKKFVESKEFLEAMEFLQCNKDFIFQFLQQKPHVVFSKNDGIPSPVMAPHFKKKEKSQAARDSTERGFSPRAFARLFIPTSSRKRSDDKKDAIVTLNPTAILRPGSRDLTSDDAKRKTGSCISSRYLLPASPKAQSKHEGSRTTDKKSGSRDVKHFLRRQSGEGVQSKHEKLRGSKALEACPSNFTLTKSLSTGKRISMMRPDEDDMSDSVGISTPKAVRTADPTASPATSRAKLTKTKTTMTTTMTTTNGLASEFSQREAVKTPTRRSAETSTRSHVSPCKTLDPASLTRCQSVPNMAMLRERGPCSNGVAKSADSSKPVRSKSSDQRTLGFFSVGKSKGSKTGHEAPEEAMPRPSPAQSVAKSSQRNAGCLPNGKDSKGVRRNILDHVKSGRNANGHSSSVSVLELSESPPGAQEFKDISNDLQDPPRIRLRRTNLDGSSKRLRTNELDPTKGRVLNQVDGNNERVRDTDFGITRETHHVKVPHQSVQRLSNADRPVLQTPNPKPAEGFALQTPNPKHAEDFALQTLNPKPAEDFALQTLNPKPAEDFALQTLNPKPSSDDFAFVCDALVASEFHTHGGRNIIRWHSATQPISPHLVERPRRAAALFDAINEVLVAKLEGSAVMPDQCFGLPIVGASNSAVRGRRFVEEVWGDIQKRQYPVVAGCEGEEEYLHGLVAQDLATTSSWGSLRRDVDRVCLQVERAVWNDLVEELCSGLLSVN